MFGLLLGGVFDHKAHLARVALQSLPGEACMSQVCHSCAQTFENNL